MSFLSSIFKPIKKLVSGNIRSFTGTSPKMKQQQMFTPEQQNVLSQLLQMGMGGIQDPQAQEQQAMNQYRENVVPGIMERFRGVGGGQGQNMASSGLGQMLMGSGQQLAGNLESQRYGRGMQQLGMGLGRQFENYQTQGTQGALPGLAKAGLSMFLPGMF